MDSRRGKSRGKSNRPLKRSLRRAVAWLLAFCMCMANMNSAAFAAEIATASNALMAATPSDAKATDSDAMEILMPEEVISGEDLAAEAVRAISEGNEFDFDSEIQVKKDDQGKKEGYEELFQGRRSFVLFADNGNGGRIRGDNPNAYGYILVQVDEKDYQAFEKEAGAVKATDSNATDSDAAERSWTLTGDEEVVFLYVNADDGSVTFTLNIENLQADDIVVPSYSELREEQKAEEEESREASEANNPAALPAEDGSENGGSAGGSGSGSGSGSAGSSDSADAEEPEKGTEDAAQAGGSGDGQGSESGTEAGSEDSTDGAGQGSGDAGNSDGAADADKPDDSDGGQNSGQDAGNSAEDGKGSQSGSGSDTGSGDTDSGKAEGSGDTGSQKPDDSGKGQNSGSGQGADKGNSGNADKGDSGKGDSDKGDSGSSSDKGSSDKGNASSDKGSSDKGSSDKGNSSSSDKGSSSSDKGGSSDTAKLSKSSYDVPVVMGPNPNAEFESDEYGDMSFDEWQEMMEEAEEEEEEDEDYEDYIEETALTYEDGDGTTYFGMSMLPAVSATVKKEKKANPIARLLRMKAAAEETPAVVMAGTAALSDLSGITITSAYKQIEELDNGNYRLHLGLAGGGEGALDVLLVVDESSSMGEDSRMDTVKKVLGGYDTRSGRFWEHHNGFVENVFDNAENAGTRFAVVPYEQKVRGSDYGYLEWTDNEQQILRAIDRLDEVTLGWFDYSDTNYEAGLWGAKEMIERRGDTSNSLVVIFLTDGCPTAYSGEMDQFDDGAVKEAGQGLNYPTYGVAQGTLTAAYGFKQYLQGKGSIYTVGFQVPPTIGGGSGNICRDYTPSQYLYAIAGSIEYKQGKFIVPTSAPDTYKEVTSTSGGISDLEEIFNDINTDLLMKNVVISDTLSDYVEFAGNDEDSANVEVVKIPVDQWGNRQDEAAEPAAYESLRFDPEQKTVSVEFGQDRELDKDYVYELRFDIKLKDEYQNGADSSLLAVGGDNTDYQNNGLSEGKNGLPTNASGHYSYGRLGNLGSDYPVPVIPVPDKPVQPDYTPEHEKYIKDNGDGTYDLTLNITSDKESSGDIEETSIPADIIFLVDKSGSMIQGINNDEYGPYEDSRAKVVNDALDSAIDILGQSSNVEFGGYKWGESVTNFIGLKANTDEAKTALELDWGEDKRIPLVGTVYAVGGDLRDSWGSTEGTYPSNVLNEVADNIQKNLRSGAKTYFIFLTDGEPSEKAQTAYNAASRIPRAVPGSKFYAVGVTGDTDVKFMETLVRKANNLADNADIDDLYINGTSEEEINQALRQIAEEIVSEIDTRTSGVTNTSITDVLSAYAEFDFDTTDTSVVSQKVKVQKTYVDASGRKQTESLEPEQYEILFGEDGKTITVHLKNVNSDPEKANELEKDVTYSITFPVKPTEEAKQNFADNKGYHRNPDGSWCETEFEGDENTDAPMNHTSSGEPGFPTNRLAYITYTYDSWTFNDGEDNEELQYPHPVLQVPQTGSFTVQKVIEGSDSEDGQKFIINIEQLVGGAPVPFSSVALVGNGEKSPAVQVDGEQQFKITEAVPMEYAFKEIRVIDENAEGADVTAAKFDSGTNTLTVASGDKLVVQVVNTFNHKGYFHSADRVTNYTTGDTSTPFTSDRVGRQAAEDQPKAESAKKKAEIEEEEGEPLV